MEKDLMRDAAQGQLPRWDGPLAHPFYSKVLKRGLDLSLIHISSFLTISFLAVSFLAIFP